MNIMEQYMTGLGMGHTPSAPRCTHSHPVLKVGKGTLLGGSCHSPAKGYDIYVGLSEGMKTTGYPWEGVIEVAYSITDQAAPSNLKSFQAMILWLCNQLRNGKKVHVGCIGGHGRTGTVLAAILAQFGDQDAIATVRKEYCTKAVESVSQVNFLVKHYKVKTAKVTPRKTLVGDLLPEPFRGGLPRKIDSIGPEVEPFSTSRKNIWIDKPSKNR